MIAFAFQTILTVSAVVSAYQDTPDYGNSNPRNCDLQRLIVNDTSEDSLAEQLVSIDAPVIIEGAISSWTALKKWSDLNYFLEKYGNVILPRNIVTNNLLDVAQDGMNLENVTEENYTLGEFVRSLLEESSGSNDSLSKPFLFEVAANHSASLTTMLVEDLQGGAGGVGYVPASLATLDILERPVLSVGGPSGGLPPHKHAASWLGLVTGRKRWTFLPPEAISPAYFAAGGATAENSMRLYAQAALNSPGMWSEELRGMLRAQDAEAGSGPGLLECTQRPGEVVFVPSGWWHATANIDQVVIGVGAQRDEMLWRFPAESEASPSTSSGEKRPRLSCAALLANLCESVKRHLPSSAEGVLIRQEVRALVENTSDEGIRIRGGAGLDSSSEVEACNAVAHREAIQAALALEPLNIRYILQYARALYLYPLEHFSKRTPSQLWYDPIVSSTHNPVLRAAKFLQRKVREVQKQLKLGHIRATDAGQMAARMGLEMDELPARAGAALACPNRPGATTCGTWGMDDTSTEKFKSILNGMVKVYLKITGDVQERAARGDDHDSGGEL